MLDLIGLAAVAALACIYAVHHSGLAKAAADRAVAAAKSAEEVVVKLVAKV
jgi:hypothetical protein